MKVLVVKTGRIETFARAAASTPSLGDVLRSTVLLHAFPECEISWITSREAAPLLMDNPLISKIAYDDEPDFFRSLSRFNDHDVVINLEASDPWITWALDCPIPGKFGVTIDGPALKGGEKWQEGLFHMIGREWKGEEYSFQPRGAPGERADIGLNWAVGGKWPTKAWDNGKWELLGDKLSREYSVSWQRGFDSIETYAAWIRGCETVITSDSLGMHLALALKKRVVALFGPTSAEEIYFYGRGIALVPDSGTFSCAPCRSRTCFKDISCMDALSVDEVHFFVSRFLSERRTDP